MSADDGFLSRWAKRKALARSGASAADVSARGPAAGDTPEPQSLPQVSLAADRALAAVETPAVATASDAATPAVVAEPAPLPTMADVARLTRSSDFSSFVQPGVDQSISNAAMKKLFSDPRYNVMDGLDTYIDDYSTPDPIPLAMLRRMNQSALLGLFDHEIEAGNDSASAEGCEQFVAGSDAPALAALPTPAPEGGCAPVAPGRTRADDDTDL